MSKKYPKGNGIYIAGPMTGFPRYNEDSFKKANVFLSKIHGGAIVNPSVIVMSIYRNNAIIATHFNYDRFIDVLKNIMEKECDTIALLPGWEKSKGAKIELHHALKNGMKVILLNQKDLDDQKID